jgi:hypothetical protein
MVFFLLLETPLLSTFFNVKAVVFGTWNIRSMYRAGSLRAVGEEISKYKLDLVGVQEVRWDGGDTE